MSRAWFSAWLGDVTDLFKNECNTNELMLISSVCVYVQMWCQQQKGMWTPLWIQPLVSVTHIRIWSRVVFLSMEVYWKTNISKIPKICIHFFWLSQLLHQAFMAHIVRIWRKNSSKYESAAKFDQKQLIFLSILIFFGILALVWQIFLHPDC